MLLKVKSIKKDLAKKMSADIHEMEKMLNDYLQYAKSQDGMRKIDQPIRQR